MNTELAYRVLDHIKQHPMQWDQGNWVGKNECGATACFAGWCVALTYGDRKLFSDGVCIADEAAELLALSDMEADNLFSGSNSFEDLRQWIEFFAADGTVCDDCGYPGRSAEDAAPTLNVCTCGEGM